MIATTWDARRRLLSTRLAGTVTAGDVERWRASIQAALARVEDGGAFRVLVDLRGYEPDDLGAHWAMRDVVPEILAAHGFRTALLDLVEGAAPPLRATRGIRCLAAAHLHHDAAKMGQQDRWLGSQRERFFTDPEKAEAWLASLSNPSPARRRAPLWRYLRTTARMLAWVAGVDALLRL